jgi:hypothetical protein
MRILLCAEITCGSTRKTVNLHVELVSAGSSGSTKAVQTLMTPTSMFPRHAPASGSEFIHQVTYYTAGSKLRLVRTRMVMIPHLSEDEGVF